MEDTSVTNNPVIYGTYSPNVPFKGRKLTVYITGKGNIYYIHCTDIKVNKKPLDQE